MIVVKKGDLDHLLFIAEYQLVKILSDSYIQFYIVYQNMLVVHLKKIFFTTKVRT